MKGPVDAAAASVAVREAWARYEELLVRVTDFWDRALAAQPGALACHRGCTSCCGPELTVLPVEAEAIRARVASLVARDTERLAARMAKKGPDAACAFLVDDRCAVYEARPVICRTHGLALRAEDRIDHCPLCFVSEAPRPEGVLDLETLNVLLVLVNRAWLAARCLDEDSPRVALSELAREACSP